MSINVLYSASNRTVSFDDMASLIQSLDEFESREGTVQVDVTVGDELVILEFIHECEDATSCGAFSRNGISEEDIDKIRSY